MDDEDWPLYLEGDEYIRYIQSGYNYSAYIDWSNANGGKKPIE